MNSPSSRHAAPRLGAVWVARLLLAAILAGTGCSVLTPKTEALKRVHETYREEFAAAFVPPPPTDGNWRVSAPLGGARDGEPLFERTLQAMRSYRQRYGEDSVEAAHLKVLEGMVYLQAGQFGMASLLAPAVQANVDKLASGTGRAARDQLLAKAYPYLVQGWQEIQFDRSQRRLLNAGADPARLQPPAPGRFVVAADNLTQLLTSLPPDKLARPEVDEGAVYLATTAAVFRLWSEFIVNANGEPRPAVAQEAANLIGRFLSPSEVAAAAQVSLDGAGVPLGRLRYVEWYGYLKQRANPATPSTGPPGR
jgi:hypothetical protein